MTGAEWVALSLLMGLLCAGGAAWYRREVDTREAKYGTVWMNRRGL